jgi:hypothetical protein
MLDWKKATSLGSEWMSVQELQQRDNPEASKKHLLQRIPHELIQKAGRMTLMLCERPFKPGATQSGKG